jgi:hypothetical protein
MGGPGVVTRVTAAPIKKRWPSASKTPIVVALSRTLELTVPRDFRSTDISTTTTFLRDLSPTWPQGPWKRPRISRSGWRGESLIFCRFPAQPGPQGAWKRPRPGPCSICIHFQPRSRSLMPSRGLFGPQPGPWGTTWGVLPVSLALRFKI